MDNQENIQTESHHNGKYNFKTNKWDYFHIAIPILFIILYPLGLFNYICGRINLNLGVLLLFVPFEIVIMFTCFLIAVFKFMRKYPEKRKVLVFIELFLPVLFAGLFLTPFGYNLRCKLWRDKDPFLCGYSYRLKKKIDIEEVQNWLKTISPDYFTDDQDWVYLKDIPKDQLPGSLKKYYHHNHSVLTSYKYGNPTIFVSNRGGFFHSSFEIGLPDFVISEKEIAESKESDEEIMLVKPGFYVFAQY